jgi:hypothetical protein
MRILSTVEVSSVTYEDYCRVLTSSNEELAFSISGISKGVVSIVNEVKEDIEKLSSKTKLDFKQLVAIFSSRESFDLLKAFKFSITAIFKALKGTLGLLSRTLLHVFKEMHESDIFQKLKAKAISAQEVIDRYPALKVLTGVALAGLILFACINGAYTGDPHYDFDLSDVVDAMQGHYTLVTLLGEPKGLMLLSLLGAGLSGLSFPWLVSNKIYLLISLCYTFAKKLKDKDISKQLFTLIKHA